MVRRWCLDYACTEDSISDWTIRKTEQIAINPFGSLSRYILGLFWSDLHDVVPAT